MFEEFESSVKELMSKNFSLSCVESFTGGLFSAIITSFSGVSKFYKGGVCTYTNEVKESIGVSKDVIDNFSAVSYECSREMSECGLRFFDSDICISFTGNAGPNPSEGKKVGLFYIGISIKKDNKVVTESYEFYLPSLNREQIRLKACKLAFQKLFLLL